jgi:hypothetical protein
VESIMVVYSANIVLAIFFRNLVDDNDDNDDNVVPWETTDLPSVKLKKDTL